MKSHTIVRMGLIVLLVLLPVAGFGEIYYSPIIDTSSTAGFGSQYQLALFDLNGGNYHAQLTATTISNTGWYIDWFALKFDGGATGIISSNGITFTGPGTWLVGDGTVSLQNYTPFPNQTWTGGYVDGTENPLSPAAVALGAPLLGGTYTWEFDFSLASALNPNPSLQIGYYYAGYAGRSSNIPSDRLSQSLQVPEPGTILLLGSGLLGVACCRRMFRK